MSQMMVLWESLCVGCALSRLQGPENSRVSHSEQPVDRPMAGRQVRQAVVS